MSPSDFYWIGSSNHRARVYYVGGSGNPGYLDYATVGNAYVVRPVVSLKSSVLVTGGTGTASDPYKLTMS